jgi:RimJ/RimL family protein N-acetyltransferase
MTTWPKHPSARTPSLQTVFPDEITTERLRLVRLCRENVSAAKLYRHMRAGAPHMGEVSEYVMWDPHETPKDTHDYLRNVEDQWDDREQATYAIYSRGEKGEAERAEVETGDVEFRDGTDVIGDGRDVVGDGGNVTRAHAEELAGTTNLNFDWDRRSAELGIWLRKPFWGRGYSGERAAALLELAFDRLDLELVGASHQDGNEQSRRAIEKYVERFGGQYDGLLRNFAPKGDEVRDLHRYTISKEQYRNAVEREG